MVKYVKASNSNLASAEVNLHNDSNNPVWVIGNIIVDGTVYEVRAKVFLENSQFGINKGPISKLYIAKDGKCIASYDRGWDVRPSDENKEVYKIITKSVKDFRKNHPYEVDELD